MRTITSQRKKALRERLEKAGGRHRAKQRQRKGDSSISNLLRNYVGCFRSPYLITQGLFKEAAVSMRKVSPIGLGLQNSLLQDVSKARNLTLK